MYTFKCNMFGNSSQLPRTTMGKDFIITHIHSQSSTSVRILALE